MRTEGTTQPFYKKLNEDFHHILTEPHTNLSKHLLKIFTTGPAAKKIEATHPREIYRRTNADLESIVEDEFITELQNNLSSIMRQSNLAKFVNDVDDMFFEAAHTWSEALSRFKEDLKMDETFFK